MLERAELTDGRKAELDGRIAENFEWLFPGMRSSDITPEELVEGRRQMLSARKDIYPDVVTAEEALWSLCSAVGREGSSFVTYTTALLWGERFGSGNGDPLKFFERIRTFV